MLEQWYCLLLQSYTDSTILLSGYNQLYGAGMDSSIHDKISKLLRLSEKAGTEAEAKSAMEKAHQLLVKYNIDMNDLKEKSDCVLIWYPQPKKQLWEEIIWGSIAALYFCSFFTDKMMNRVDYCLAGRKDNCLVAKAVSLYVVGVADDIVPKKSSAAYAKSFKYGFAERISERAKELACKETLLSNGTQIMLHPLYNKALEEIEEFYQEEGIKLNTPKRSISIKSEEARRQGREAAEKVPLTKDLLEE